MTFIKKNLLIISILFTFIGCKENNSGENKSYFTKSNTNNEPINNIETKNGTENKTLQKLGISTKNGIIIIDVNKTKSFLEKVSKKLEDEVEKIKEENKNIKAKDIGIESNSKKIIIDINKTSNFLNKVSHELENFANELEEIFNESK